jgi:hypothetical protein
MFRLAAILYVLIATVLAGVAVTTLLTLKMMEPWQIAGGAVCGALVAIPVAWLISRQIYSTLGGKA